MIWMHVRMCGCERTNAHCQGADRARSRKPGPDAPCTRPADPRQQHDRQGNSEKALIDGLNGTASFVLNNGVLVNANLEQQLCRGISILNRKTLSGEPRAKDTPFQQLNGTLVMRNGVASNPDLKMRIPGMTVNGNGDVDLRVLGMNYRVGIIVEGDKSDMPDPACEINPRFVGIEWPVQCRGPLELGAKACRLDKEGVGQIAAKLAGDRISEKLEDKLNEKLGDKVKKGQWLAEIDPLVLRNTLRQAEVDEEKLQA
ncbi:AsmA family protein, partial [Pseudomonas syringae pv. actinidiae]|nr:AsmA family protein [Pseudomonas syringae pv. actinidiae]